MVQKAQLRALIFALLLTIFIHHPFLLHSRSLGTAPSLAPASGVAIGHGARPCKGRNDHEKRKRGSIPGTCHSKCNQCNPCLPVEVSIRAMELEEEEYYPQVWKCICHDNIFSP